MNQILHTYRALEEMIAADPSRLDLLITINELRTNFPWVTQVPPPPPVSAPPIATVPPPPPQAPPPRAAVPVKPGQRVPITIEHDVKTTIDEVLQVLGARYSVFQYSGRLVELQTDPGKDIKFLVREIANPRMVPVTPTRAWFLAGQECKFNSEKKNKDGTSIVSEQLAPEWIGRSLTALPVFDHIPALSALAQAPTLRSDGALISEPGYDMSTGILLVSDVGVCVTENPTLFDAQQALAQILDLVCDFDFVTTAGKSAWVAGLLSVVARHTFDGPAPIFIIDASKRGSGKTMLVDLASIIATGNRAPKMFYTNDDTEMDKRISALAIAGDSMVLIDNIVGKLASPPLDAALTSTSYQGRLLGKSEMTSLSMKIVWFATGNGMIIGADTSRRAIFSRLEPSVDHPESRTGPRPGTPWKYSNILNYAKQHRGELLSAALTIVSAYIRAGRPPIHLAAATGEIGSFEGWSTTIRSALVWAGAVDPCETIKDAQAADVEDIALRTMVECWPVADDVIVTAATLIEKAETSMSANEDTAKKMWRNALLEWLPARSGAQLPTARDLGYALRSIKGSVIGKFKIDAGEHTASGIPWKRVRLGTVAHVLVDDDVPSLTVIK